MKDHSWKISVGVIAAGIIILSAVLLHDFIQKENYYSEYAFDGDMLIQYVCKTGKSMAAYDDDTDDGKYKMIVRTDGVLEMTFGVEDSKEVFYGEVPKLTKKLSESEMDGLKERITASGIKKIAEIRGRSRTGSADISQYGDQDGSIYVYSNGNTYIVGNDEWENNSSLKNLSEWMEGLMSEEEQTELEQMREDYLKEPQYDFDDTISDRIITFNDCVEGDISSLSYAAHIYLTETGKVSVYGSNALNEESIKKFNNYYYRQKQALTPAELNKVKELVKDCNFADYAEYAEEGRFSMNNGRYITVSFNGKLFYAVDDGNNPDLTRLIDGYLAIVLTGKGEPLGIRTGTGISKGYFIRYSEKIAEKRNADFYWQNTQGYDTKIVTEISLNDDGKIKIYDEADMRTEQYKERQEAYMDSVRTDVSDEDVEKLKELIDESDFFDYAVLDESPVGATHAPYSASINEITASLCVCVDNDMYYAIDDGTNPKLTKLINAYLDIVLTDGRILEE